MSRPFTVNANRFEPYSTSRFLIYFDKSTTPVAGVSKVSGLRRTSDPIEYREGGNALTRKGLGRTKYEPITLDRAITHDDTFRRWADAPQVLDTGAAVTSLKDLRKTVRIVLLNERGQPVHGFIVWRAWVASYEALPQLDAGASAVAMEQIKLEHEGWEQDLTITEPNQSQ